MIWQNPSPSIWSLSPRPSEKEGSKRLLLTLSVLRDGAPELRLVRLELIAPQRDCGQGKYLFERLIVSLLTASASLGLISLTILRVISLMGFTSQHYSESRLCGADTLRWQYDLNYLLLLIPSRRNHRSLRRDPADVT